MPLIQHSWQHQTQPPQPRWSPLALRAAALVHTGAGDVRDRNGAAIPLVSAAAATRPNEDGAYLLGRGEEGQTRLGRWNLLAAQPASITAYSLVFRLRRSSQAFDGQLVAWGESAVARRNVVLATPTGLRIDARQGPYDTPRSETYALSAGVTHTWGVRVVAGVGIEVYRDGILQTPTASSGTMPASSLYRTNSQPVWMGGEAEYSALGVLYGYGLWFEDLGSDTVRALSADIHNQLHEPLRIWVPVSAGGGATSLILSDAGHEHTADSLVLTTSTALSVADATHGHSVDSLTLSIGVSLAINDATHGHAADNLTLSTAGSTSLTVADATHAHAADAPALSVDSLLAVADALHAHSADNVVLGVSGAADLVIADATHAHSVDGLVLTAQSLLAIQDALHAHAADALTLNSAPTLLIAEALHAHTADGLAITVDAWLVVADAAHGHDAANIVLTTPSSAAAADVWNYVLSNGLTAGQNLVLAVQLLRELHLVHGLTPGSPLTVAPTSRTAGAVAQTIAEAAGIVTVTRDP